MDLTDFTQVESYPSQVQTAATRLTEFIGYCEAEVGRRFWDWTSFEQFAIENFRVFWELLLRYSEFPLSGSVQPACVGDDCERAKFFRMFSSTTLKCC
jgi:acetoacetyl-CoA synthetase